MHDNTPKAHFVLFCLSNNTPAVCPTSVLHKVLQNGWYMERVFEMINNQAEEDNLKPIYYDVTNY